MNRVKEFGRVVRKWRRARGFTQEKLAELANLHVNSISLIERGLVPPTLDSILLIADALGVKVSDLVDEMEAAADKSNFIEES